MKKQVTHLLLGTAGLAIAFTNLMFVAAIIINAQEYSFSTLWRLIFYVVSIIMTMTGTYLIMVTSPHLLSYAQLKAKELQ